MKKLVLSMVFFVLLIVSGLFTINKLYTYSIVFITLTVLTFIYLLILLFRKEDPFNKFQREFNVITKTYDPILVEVKKIPEFDVKNIILLPFFEKIVDIQYDLKKPILYFKNDNTCSFMLLDVDIAYVYVLKVEDNVISPIDDVIAKIELETIKRKNNKKILEDIDKTTIIRLDDLKEYRVSPIRKIDLNNTSEISIIREDLEVNVGVNNNLKKNKKNKVTDRSRKWRLSQKNKKNNL